MKLAHCLALVFTVFQATVLCAARLHVGADGSKYQYDDKGNVVGQLHIDPKTNRIFWSRRTSHGIYTADWAAPEVEAAVFALYRNSPTLQSYQKQALLSFDRRNAVAVSPVSVARGTSVHGLQTSTAAGEGAKSRLLAPSSAAAGEGGEIGARENVAGKALFEVNKNKFDGGSPATLQELESTLSGKSTTLECSEGFIRVDQGKTTPSHYKPIFKAAHFYGQGQGLGRGIGQELGEEVSLGFGCNIDSQHIANSKIPIQRTLEGRQAYWDYPMETFDPSFDPATPVLVFNKWGTKITTEIRKTSKPGEWIVRHSDNMHGAEWQSYCTLSTADLVTRPLPTLIGEIGLKAAERKVQELEALVALTKLNPRDMEYVKLITQKSHPLVKNLQQTLIEGLEPTHELAYEGYLSQEDPRRKVSIKPSARENGLRKIDAVRQRANAVIQSLQRYVEAPG